MEVGEVAKKEGGRFMVTKGDVLTLFRLAIGDNFEKDEILTRSAGEK